jgi:hypothetical protein
MGTTKSSTPTGFEPRRVAEAIRKPARRVLHGLGLIRNA